MAMAEGGLADYIRVHFERRNDPDYTGLCIAENHQVFHLLQPKLESLPAVPDHVAAYDDMSGKRDLRTAVAGLFQQHIFDRPVDPQHVQFLAGAGGVLDAVGHALGDPGDGVLVPTPSYAGFWPDLEIRPGLRIVPVPTEPDAEFQLTTDLLDRAWDTASGPIRMLLLTNPDNPRGQIMSTDDLESVLEWARARGIHVIADEIYALSVFGPTPFTSVGRLRRDLGDDLHVIWAFSKDFGMSGLRCGVLVTQNEALHDTIELQGSWAGVSGHTQHLLAAMLNDHPWVRDYLGEMRHGLRESATVVTRELTRAGIPHVVPDAGFFVLCDLRRWLDEPSWESEHRLWTRILDTTGVNLTPGSACRAPEPGFVRLCHASNPTDAVESAVRAVVAQLSDPG